MTNKTDQQKAFKKYARFSGMFKIIVGSVFSFFVFRSLLNGETTAKGGYQLISMAIPMAFVLVGFLEFLSGYPFLKFSQAWDELKGWQRGILGTLIVIFSFILIMFGMIWFG